MGQPSVNSDTRVVNPGASGPPVFTYEPRPGTPAIGVVRIDRATTRGVSGDAHAHDFPGLAYFERGGGSLRSGGHDWPVRDGDVFVLVPGEVMGAGDAEGLRDAEGWGLYFTPQALAGKAAVPLLAWRTQPLLRPFAPVPRARALQINVPLADRATWSARLAALQAELQARRDGYRDAALAQLTLLAVDLGRLVGAGTTVPDRAADPLVTAVFGVIEERYHEAISLRDVAAAVGLSPGHLTTIVRRRTGRTVQQWIGERRMTAARRLLVETDRTVEDVGRDVGYTDPAYFVRVFRKANGLSPLRWRRASRDVSPGAARSC